jgi:two-component system, OmpR family, response regulator MprA
MARILVIDDDEQLGSALRRALAYDDYDVGLARDGIEGLRLAHQLEPDLVVLDVLMPSIDGFEVCRRLRAGGDVPILMLTARDEIADRVQGLDSGADDYLVKPFAVDEFLARVRALLRRRASDGRVAQELRFGDLQLDTITREAFRGERRIELSTREYELLALFLSNPGRVLSRETIFDRIWNYDFGSHSNLIEVYVGYLRQKLERGGGTRLIQTVRGAGYVLRDGGGRRWTEGGGD